ncbi:MAG: RHS repeat-associated core domain-containing protein [Kiritimatiellia bacterium]|jgi:RHS repeat-associated protein|nr:RHS repeat-associated core domain-containing protein [Kiritimatiellia bacterium]
MSVPHKAENNYTHSHRPTVVGGASYAILADFGTASAATLERNRKSVAKARANGAADSSEPVLCGSLNLMAQKWAQQVHMATHVAGKARGALGRYLILGGIARQSTGYGVDLGIQKYRGFSLTGDTDDVLAAYRTSGLMGSAFEHAVLEQYQGSENEAVSTVKLLWKGNDGGGKTFRATSANWSSIESQLQDYDSATIDNIDWWITTAGHDVLIPEYGNLLINGWQGAGYLAFKTGSNISTAYVISDNENGGAVGSGVLQPSGFFNEGGAMQRASGHLSHARNLLRLGSGLPRGLDLSLLYDSSQCYAKRSTGYGWQHNLDISANLISDPNPSLGARQPMDLVPLIVRCVVVGDLLKDGLAPENYLISSIVTKWESDHVIDNAVAVRLGERTHEYVKMPDGTFNPPPGVTDQLIETNGAYRLLKRYGTQYDFNTNGMLASIQDADSNNVSFAYNAQTNLQTVTDAYGRTLTFGYTGDLLSSVTESAGGLSRSVALDYTDDQLTGVTDVEGNEWEYEYTTNGLLAAVIDPLSQVVQSNIYNAVGHVVTQFNGNSGPWALSWSGYTKRIGDSLGGEQTHEFDDDGRLIAQTDALGNTAYRFYDGQGHVVSNIDARGAATVYQYDDSHNMTNRIDSLGNEWKREYDEQHRLVKTIDPLGNETCFGYDANHHLTNTVDALSNSTARTYYTGGSDKGLLYTMTDPNGNLTTYTYSTNSYGMPYTVTRTDGGTVTNSWSARGDLLTSWDALGNPTTRTYDKRRLLTSVTDALSNSVSNQYNAAGLRTKVTDQLDRETVTTWTPTYKVATVTYPDSSVVSNSYDSRDLLIAVEDGRDYVSSHLYDAAHRRIGIVDPLTNSVTFALDENGNITARTNATGHVTYYALDALNRVTNQWDSVGGGTRENISAFDKAGRLVASTNALGQGTQYALDALGRRIETVRADGESEYFTYDPVGRLLAFTNGAGETAMQYLYDGMNRVTNEINALGYSRSFEYDPAGNRTKRIDADGNQTEYTFDVLNRLTVIDYPGSSEARFEYAPWGGLTLASNFTAVVSYGHDAMNRVTSITQSVASAESVVNYTYDYNGNRTAVEYPNGDGVTFLYDAANRLSDITGDLGAYDFAWDEAGRLTDIEYPNGVDAVYAHDVAGQLTNFSYGTGASPFLERGITRDLLGRKSVESIEAGLEIVPPDTHQFHYNDEADRVEHVSRMDTYEHPEAWRDYNPGYSQEGNVTNIIEGYNGQHLTHTLSWDYDNRLTAFNGELSTNLWTGTPPLPESRYFGYDARGNRVSRSVTGSPASVHVLDHAASLANVLAEAKSDGTVLRVYLWAPGVGLLAHQDVGGSGTNRYYHADELGSTLAITDGGGTATDKFFYLPYGELAGRTGTTETPYTFVGRYGVYWEDGPLYHMKARYYHVGLKRWISSDPLGIDGGVNLYAYANGNPQRYLDPWGLGGAAAGTFNVDSVPDWDSSMFQMGYVHSVAANAAVPGAGPTVTPWGGVPGVYQVEQPLWRDVVFGPQVYMEDGKPALVTGVPPALFPGSRGVDPHSIRRAKHLLKTQGRRQVLREVMTRPEPIVPPTTPSKGGTIFGRALEALGELRQFLDLLGGGL